MRLNQINQINQITPESVATIATHCSEFLAESGGVPLVKHLHGITGRDLYRIKLRHKKEKTGFDAAENIAMKEAHNINRVRTRALYANGGNGDASDMFYVFVPNGYRYLYCDTIKNSSIEFKEQFSELLSLQLDIVGAVKMVAETMALTYKKTNLSEALSSGCEIVFHNISSFYAVPVSNIPHYQSLYSRLYGLY